MEASGDCRITPLNLAFEAIFAVGNVPRLKPHRIIYSGTATIFLMRS